eukprot:GHRR01001713.1.p1 GENE.GHRR01001713.1~~GHRR01001713.1.p1  ORF type:complete len:1175 (+),score=492.98 GHRR01001713.1:413-3937(+)
MDAWQQKRQRKRQAAAVRKLEPVKADLSSDLFTKESKTHAASLFVSCKQHRMRLQPIILSGSTKCQCLDHNVTANNTFGQAVLHLPLQRADVYMRLPPTLQVAATPAGGLDCRISLLEVAVDWPATRHTSAAGDQEPQPRVLPAKSAAASFACRSGALLLAHTLFPQHISSLLGWLAVPVAAADALGAAGAAVPGPAKQAVAVQASRLKRRLQGKAEKQQQQYGLQERSAGGVGWVDTVCGVMAGTMHTLRCLSGPAALLASAGWLWSMLHPSSHNLATCMVAVLAVAADYSQLSTDTQKGRIKPGKQMEAAWHARHKAAARQLAAYCRDLPATPPLQPLANLAARCSIAAGLAIDGQGLMGCAGAAQHSDLVAARKLSKSAGSLDTGTKLQLMLSGGFDASDKSKSMHDQHEGIGLSRSQLTELFTGQAATQAAATQSSMYDTCGSLNAMAEPEVQQGSQLIQASQSKPKMQQHQQPQLTSQLWIRRVLARCQHTWRWQWQQEKQQMRDNAMVASQQPSVQQQQLSGDPLAFIDTLPLYGRQDHVASSAAVQFKPAWPVRMTTGLELVVRAVYLAMVFAPFLLLGVPLLLTAWYLTSRVAATQQRQLQPKPAEVPPAASSGTAQLQLHKAAFRHHRAPFGAVGHRLLAVLMLPLQLLSYVLVLLDLLVVFLLGGLVPGGAGTWESAAMSLRRRAWQALLYSCSRAGAAFIKWGQWSSSRRDIFPEDFCDALASLHDRAPIHGYKHTRRQVEAAFGVKLNQLFNSFDPKPLASGSIAQVHRATLRPSSVQHMVNGQLKGQLKGSSSSSSKGHRQAALNASQVQELAGNGTMTDTEALVEVVVKVAHPRVARHIALDFQLLAALSNAAAKLPALRGLSIRQSIAQFTHTMTAQTDLRVEAVHALRFYNNFSGVASSVTIPRPIPGLVSDQVLVETFEAGRSVAKFMKEATPLNTHIVALGVDAYLKMLLVDNFVHTDLHPGNILFRSVSAITASKQLRRRQQQQQPQPVQQPPQAYEVGNTAGLQAEETAQLVLLDFGLAEELTDEVRHHFISFLNAIAAGDGVCAACHLLQWSNEQTCPDARAFTADVVQLFRERCNIHSEAGINLDLVMKSVLGLARKHHISIDSCYASLVISVCVLVGFANALDPGVNLMDAATPTLLAYSMTGKVVGRLYS